MKKLLFILFLIGSFSSKATSYISIKSGAYDDPNTWNIGGGSVPHFGDNIEIVSGDVVTYSNPWYNVGGTQVDAGGTFVINSEINLYNYVINNGTISGNGSIYIQNGHTEHGTVNISGSGSWSSYKGSLFFASDIINIASGSTFNFGSATIYLDPLDNASSTVTINNQGNFSATNINNYVTGLAASKIPCTWNNLASSSLTITQNSFNCSCVFNASAISNTVTFQGTCNINIPSGNTYYNLVSNPVGSSSCNLLGNLNVTNFTSSTGYCDFNNFTMTLAGNWTNNSLGTPNKGLITFNGASLQTIGGTTTTGFSSGITLSSGTDVQLAIATLVNGGNLTIKTNATLNCQNFQLSGTAAGTFTLASGASLILGLPTSATSVVFPTNFTTANISLDPASTVTYEANAAQVVSATPSPYGNLIISTGASASTKTIAASPLQIAGNLTVNSNATLNGAANTITLTGNLINNGGLSFTTGAFNISGNFTNNHTFTGGTNTTTFAGSSGQTIGGTSSTTFYNLTATGSGAETVTLGFAETVTNNLLISAGTFDVSASNYSLTVGGNLTTNGTLNTRSGLITLNGSSQTISGSTIIPFYDLTVNETSSAQTVTLGASETFSDVLTMTKGTLASSGANTMTLISTAGGTGRIAQITAGNANITAAFVAQRYESSRGTTANYASLSTPFTNVETVGDWNTSNQSGANVFYMSINGGANGLAHYSNGQPYYSVYTINEASTSTGYAEYVPVTTAATTISAGEGLYCWLGTSLSAMSNPFTYIQHGSPSVGTIAVSVSRTVAGQNGFNLIGNPYASPISWAQFQTDNAGLSLQNQYYVMGTGGSWENSVTNGLPDGIPMCQGFGILVQAAAGSYTANFKEDQKTSGNQSLNKPIRENINYANIVLTDDSNTNSCRTTVAFGSNYVKTYDAGIDAYFIHSKALGVPVLYTLTENNDNMMYKALPDNEQTIDVPLTAIGQVKANYTLTVNSEALTSYQCINLVDKTTGQVINNFNTNHAYTFYIPKAGAEKDFVLRFTKLSGEQSCNSSSIASAETLSDNNVSIASAYNGAAVNFNLQQECTATISVYNVLGQKVMSDITTNAFNNRVLINLSEGQLYIIKVQTPDGMVVKKLYR